jgi:hypothetical protein
MDSERDLIEKLLTAQVMTLARVIKARKVGKTSVVGDGSFIEEAIGLVRDNQHKIIQSLLSKP